MTVFSLQQFMKDKQRELQHTEGNKKRLEIIHKALTVTLFCDLQDNLQNEEPTRPAKS